MKALDWQQFFTEQREKHGKVLFSVAELANVAQTSLHALNTELGRLVKRGVVVRYAQGRYGPPQGVEVSTLVASLDASAYITGFYALFLHQMVTQVPTEITCFTRRRHNRRTNRDTPVGRLEFVCVPPAVYHRPPGAVSAEQALCDFVWLMLRSGIEVRSLVTFNHLERFKPRKLALHLKRYPANVRDAVFGILAAAPRVSSANARV